MDKWGAIEWRIFIHLYGRWSSWNKYEKEQSCLCFENWEALFIMHNWTKLKFVGMKPKKATAMIAITGNGGN